MSARKAAKSGTPRPAASLPEGAGASAPAAPSFEATIHRLGEIVEELESGELPLEESVRLFEEGVALARRSQKILDGAERRVEQLLGVDDDEEPIVKPLPEEDLP